MLYLLSEENWLVFIRIQDSTLCGMEQLLLHNSHQRFRVCVVVEQCDHGLITETAFFERGEYICGRSYLLSWCTLAHPDTNQLWLIAVSSKPLLLSCIVIWCWNCSFNLTWIFKWPYLWNASQLPLVPKLFGRSSTLSWKWPTNLYSFILIGAFFVAKPKYTLLFHISINNLHGA